LTTSPPSCAECHEIWEFKKEKNSNIQPHLITQAEFNDLVRDLGLPKIKAQFLGSRLQQWKLIEQGESVVLEEEVVKQALYFSMDGDLVCVNDGCVLMEELPNSTCP
jgi:hypothetical protein